MITFTEAINENQKFILSPGCKTEIEGYFTDLRVDKNTIPEGWYSYEFRDNEHGNFCTLEKNVLVNHGGTFLTQKEIPMPKGYRCLSGRGGWTFV